MRFRTLHVAHAVLVDEAVLEALLGVVPGSAARGHRDRHEDAGDDHAHQHGADGREGVVLAGDPVDHEIGHDRRQHRQERGHHHFLDRGLRQQVDGAGVIRPFRALHDAGLLLELPAHFLDDGARRAAHRRHGHAAEEEGDQAAEQQPDDDVGVGQREIDRHPLEVLEGGRPRLVGFADEEVQVRGIGREEHESAEAGRADRVALGDRLGGVADGVERIGGVADFLGQARHLGDAAGIVRHRAEGVERDDDASQRQHGRGGDGDAEEAGKAVGHDDAGDDDDGGHRGRFQGHREALDDVGAVAGHRGLGDRDHRTLAGAGVVLGDDDDEQRHRETDQRAGKEAARGEADALHGLEGSGEAAEHRIVHGGDRADREHAGRDEALVERPHDRLVGAELHEEGADDRGDDTGRADRHRIKHHRAEHRLTGEEDRRQHHRRDQRHRIGLEQVGRHAGAVADIVADIVGDGRGVARIVLRDPGLDLADKVGAHVSALGEDAAAKTGEDRDQRGAEAQRHERIDDGATGGFEAESRGQDAVVDRDAEQSEAGNEQAGDRAGFERDVEALAQRLHRGLRRADVGAHRDVHADETGRAREDRTDQEADRHPFAEQPGERDEKHDADHGNGDVLTLEIGLRAFGDRTGNLLHALVAGIALHHIAIGPDAVGYGKRTQYDDEKQS